MGKHRAMGALTAAAPARRIDLSYGASVAPSLRAAE